MKHGVWLEIATATGFSLVDRQLLLLEEYRTWLLTEAIPGGGVGPNEEPRLTDRHIGDSLLFSWPFVDPPPDLLDLGTGVGLPGIPLAILWPSTSVTLLDRSGKRTDLARRAVRVLGLDNVEVVRGDIEGWGRAFSHLVTRAAIPPGQLAPHLNRLLRPGGIAVAGGSWTDPPEIEGWERIEILLEMLDRTVWLLIMRRA